MHMAVAGDDGGNLDATPADFDDDQIILAESHGVVLKVVSSKTAEETYRANVCPYCDAFIGKHFIYAHYYVEALYGRLKYERV